MESKPTTISNFKPTFWVWKSRFDDVILLQYSSEMSICIQKCPLEELVWLQGETIHYRNFDNTEFDEVDLISKVPKKFRSTILNGLLNEESVNYCLDLLKKYNKI